MTLFNKFQKLQNSKSSQCFDLLELRCRYWSPVQTSRGGGGNLACKLHFQRATLVYRSLQGLAPNYLSSEFERRQIAYNLLVRDSEL